MAARAQRCLGSGCSRVVGSELWGPGHLGLLEPAPPAAHTQLLCVGLMPSGYRNEQLD